MNTQLVVKDPWGGVGTQYTDYFLDEAVKAEKRDDEELACSLFLLAMRAERNGGWLKLDRRAAPHYTTRRP